MECKHFWAKWHELHALATIGTMYILDHDDAQRQYEIDYV